LPLIYRIQPLTMERIPARHILLDVVLSLLLLRL
jgi:hypothetical protein